MNQIDRFRSGTEKMSAYEREILRQAMEAALNLRDPEEQEQMFDIVTRFAQVRDQAARKRESDARTDARRRKLIGARLPIEQALRCRDSAAALGVSCYRFVADALERECRRVEALARSPGVTDCPAMGNQGGGLQAPLTGPGASALPDSPVYHPGQG